MIWYWRLFGRTAAIIMTCSAITGRTGIVNPGATYEGCSGMTG